MNRSETHDMLGIPLAEHSTPVWKRVVIGWLALVCLALSACQATSLPQAAKSTVSTAPQRTLSPAPHVTASAPAQTTPSSPMQPIQGTTLTPTSAAASRNHVPPSSSPLFASITYAPSTAYDQAVSLLRSVGQTPYPWTCDDPRAPIPPPAEQQRAAYASSHQLLVSYPSDDQLNRLAALPQVRSVDVAILYMCP
jgi:hypothetical protein